MERKKERESENCTEGNNRRVDRGREKEIEGEVDMSKQRVSQKTEEIEIEEGRVRDSFRLWILSNNNIPVNVF